MLYEPTYQAARKVSETVRNHFAHHIATAHKQGEQKLATAPGADVIEQIIDVAFWASLRKEEGNSPKISLAFLSPQQAEKALVFEKELPLNPVTITKIAPGVERAGIHIGVWFKNDELVIWGTTITIPNFCFVLDVSEPGLLVIKHRRIFGLGKYTNVAVLKGDDVRIVDEHSATFTDCPAIVTTLLGYTSPASWNDSVNVLIQLAVSMRAHGHGGSLLVVPACSEEWKQSIIHPIKYAIQPAFSGLADLIMNEGTDQSDIFWKSALSREVDNIGGLTGVDGATIINTKHELLAFGSKIVMREGSSRVKQMCLIEPIIDGQAVIIHPAQNGGTRHLSAAQFVHDQHDAIALVASQDGQFTIFTWSPHHGMVQAYRIDTLLL
ncbi:putative sensor domain DACNV-containing protein [Mucilaginibacter paludis]|uniref:Probable sensor domain-containing protein n=1 Tax=Mucilaginibacter paludis DSM 18603 TaxID=714943 RepID=H1Y549_9SPHI|nr:hypothetical protein [Mucilaginibacter paludis]EHQ28592.1 hypothetical protein Mucpa_4502 [Mucilaginibacter paludis DSM 18603]